MPELTKGKYSTIQIPRSVKELLKAYRDTFKFASYVKALINALELSLEYRKLGQLVYKKELGEMKKNERKNK